LQALRNLIEHLCRDVGPMLGHERSKVIDRHDATSQRIQMTLRFVELAFQAFVEIAVIGHRTKLVVQRRVVELPLCELNVVARPFDAKHVLDPSEELIVIERLGDVIVRAGSEALDSRTEISGSREKDHREEAVLRDALDDSARVDAAETRHVDVQEHEVDRLGTYGVDRLLTASGQNDGEPSRLEDPGDVVTRCAIVIGNDHDRL
jgi:hypothetical protein